MSVRGGEAERASDFGTPLVGTPSPPRRLSPISPTPAPPLSPPVRGRPYFSRQKVSRPSTGGISLKSWGGGGDEVRHSSVRPSQASPGAGAPATRLRHALTMNRATAAAIPNAPTVEMKFQNVHPASAA